MDEDPGIRPAAPADGPALSGVLAAAFAGDPLNDWLLPDRATRERRLRLGMGHVLCEVYVPRGGALTTAARDGVALWERPGDEQPSGLRQLRGLPAFVRTFGRRLPRAMRAFDSVEHRRPEEDHWFLDVLAVAPGRQGRGIGSALVRAGTAEADAAGAPAFLATSNARNVPLYERLGFAVGEEYDLGPVHVWTMLRPARA
jgi:ribosomal protein S18 acetylase RimI-like enzyme